MITIPRLPMFLCGRRTAWRARFVAPGTANNRCRHICSIPSLDTSDSSASLPTADGTAADRDMGKQKASTRALCQAYRRPRPAHPTMLAAASYAATTSQPIPCEFSRRPTTGTQPCESTCMASGLAESPWQTLKCKVIYLSKRKRHERAGGLIPPCNRHFDLGSNQAPGSSGRRRGVRHNTNVCAKSGSGSILRRQLTGATGLTEKSSFGTRQARNLPGPLACLMHSSIAEFENREVADPARVINNDILFLIVLLPLVVITLLYLASISLAIGSESFAIR